jgi:hypothetical protein
MSSIEDNGPIIYPYCYEIKEGCPPCNRVQGDCNDENCLEELSKFLLISENHPKKGSRRGRYIEEESLAFEQVKHCLQKYGDIYNELDILPYVNPTTKDVLFPDQIRIQSRFNQFIRNLSTSHDKENDKYKIKLFNILLNTKLREVYNSLYNQPLFANPKSLEPTDPGIGALMEKSKKVTYADEYAPSAGGKKRKRKTKKKHSNKIKRTKRRKQTKRIK